MAALIRTPTNCGCRLPFPQILLMASTTNFFHFFLLSDIKDKNLSGISPVTSDVVEHLYMYLSGL